MNSKKKNGFRVLFISASFEDRWRSPVINQNSHYPLGLGYLHSYLEKMGHNVTTLFLNDYSYADCFAEVNDSLKKFSPEFVGFNILTNNRTASFRLIEHIHDNFPRIRILIGGIHTTLMYRQIIRKFPYVTAVIGEGEITTAELLDKLKKHLPLNRVKGIAYFSGGRIITTPPRDLIGNLDTLPFPKHEIFFSANRTIASMITSRGCPFSCSFCVLKNISQRIYRKRSVANVISEIEYLISEYPQLETVWLHDDQFFLINQRVIDFCNEIVRRGIKLRFICSGRFKPVSAEMVRALAKAGFVEVMLGLESGSPEILKKCRKMITHEDVINTLTLFKDSPIFVVAFLIVGLYGENDATVRESYGFVRKMQKIKYLFFGDISILTVYPGTEIYDIAKKAGVIGDSYWLTDKPTPFFTVEHSETELIRYKNITLDHISLLRYPTLRGFAAQLPMTPYILKFFWSNITQAPMVIRHLVQRFYPGIYSQINNIGFGKHPEN